MKTLTTLFFVFFISSSVIGQSNTVKLGVALRNVNFLAAEGGPGLQLGYSRDFSEGMRFELNFGNVAFSRNQSYGGMNIFVEAEETNYTEALLLFPIFTKKITSKNLKAGFGYIASVNTFEFADYTLINSPLNGSSMTVESQTFSKLTYNLHEIALALSYDYNISEKLVANLSGAVSATLNTLPTYSYTISSYNESSSSSITSSINEAWRTQHYRLSLGLGYRF